MEQQSPPQEQGGKRRIPAQRDFIPPGKAQVRTGEFAAFRIRSLEFPDRFPNHGFFDLSIACKRPIDHLPEQRHRATGSHAAPIIDGKASCRLARWPAYAPLKSYYLSAA
ncbi:hypothetical protein [Cupriavidus malaysiensis]|uniref:hypothetical protein n=1 Tax=Cupriavidus malaysiensis TaxID=367825 RepID=UPI0012FFAEE7|nr:hypothetical protein [Cupriavidus malaysiensis]